MKFEPMKLHHEISLFLFSVGPQWRSRLGLVLGLGVERDAKLFLSQIRALLPPRVFLKVAPVTNSLITPKNELHRFKEWL